jgi:hypothetical protein
VQCDECFSSILALPVTGSFDVMAAERVLEFFGPPHAALLDQESADHYTPLMQVKPVAVLCSLLLLLLLLL